MQHTSVPSSWLTLSGRMDPRFHIAVAAEAKHRGIDPDNTKAIKALMDEIEDLGLTPKGQGKKPEPLYWPKSKIAAFHRRVRESLGEA